MRDIAGGGPGIGGYKRKGRQVALPPPLAAFRLETYQLNVLPSSMPIAEVLFDAVPAAPVAKS
jgi:hypothetical protein